MAVIVDTPSGPASTGGDSSYSQCRKWIIERNSSVEVVRIKLTSLRLDEDALDRLLSYLKGSGSALSARESSYRARHGPLWASDKVPNVRMSFGPGSSSIPRLRTIRMPVSLLQARPSSASVPASMWSLPSLLSTLQLIFPHATVNCTPCLLVDDWHASSSENSLSASRGFKRLTDLARLKVFSDRRFSEERRIHQLFLSKVKDELEEPKTGCESRKKEAKRMINKLRENIISVLGVISVTSSYSHAAMSLDRDLSYANMSPWNHTKRPPCFVSVEACVGSIILRECGLRNSAHSKGRESETILVVGSFDAQLEEFLSSLFGSCGLLPLQPASDISRTGLTHKVMENIQSKYCGANNSLTPLPSGWWYDGKMYVDIHGYKSEFRPDIDIFLDQYIIEQNNKILNYNELLQFTQSS